MSILEQIYEINFTKINFLERKISIQNPNTILIGPPKSGKSYLIYDYLSRFEPGEYLYIDLGDYKNRVDEIKNSLDKFLANYSIKVLVIENFDFTFSLPKVSSTIITTNILLKEIDDFEILAVYPLDFEEFLLFDTKHNNLLNSFNSFLKFGGFPEILEYNEHKKHNRNIEICKLYSQDHTYFEILMIVIKFAGEKKSVFQLYNTLKKEIKISKDKFYKVFDQYESNKILFQCPKYNQPNGVKKLFVFNHALIDLVSYKKNFNNLFKNMVFLELHYKNEDIYYLENIDFYLSQNAHVVLAIPFFNTLVSSTIISKLLPHIQEHCIKRITIVTISTEQTLFIEEIEASVVPFYNWALSL
jgi:uncharacterized protein